MAHDYLRRPAADRWDGVAAVLADQAGHLAAARPGHPGHFVPHHRAAFE